jgi:hypothetical protein
MNNLNKHWLSRWLRRMRKPTESHRDFRRPVAYIKVLPPFLEFCTAEGQVYQSEYDVSHSSIQVKVIVGNIRWNEAQSLQGINSNEQVYTLDRSPDGGIKVSFGDGVEGACPPSRARNVSASYRSGTGYQFR